MALKSLLDLTQNQGQVLPKHPSWHISISASFKYRQITQWLVDRKTNFEEFAHVWLMFKKLNLDEETSKNRKISRTFAEFYVIGLSRLVRCDFFHVNLSKCSVFPVTQQLSQKAWDKFLGTGNTLQTKEVLKKKFIFYRRKIYQYWKANSYCPRGQITYEKREL